jgi:penicillin-binding protein 1C
MGKKNRKKIWKLVNKLLFLGFLGFFILFGGLAIWTTTFNLPNLENFEERKVAQSTKIYDRTGEIVLYDVHGDIKRTIIPLEEISDFAQKATIAVEDKNFYSHGGIEPLAIVRAILKNIASGDLLGGQGGSTITQQVIKNALLTSDKKVSRKLKEWVLAPRLENVLTKDEILEVYLNEVPYGGNVYGIQEASLRFFGKEAKDINLAEAAFLAALPQAPTYYSPYGNNVVDLVNRKNFVLDQMVIVGFITEEEAQQAKEENVIFQKQQQFGIKAPHFVMYIIEILEEQYGKDIIQEGGLRVITSLDWELQQKAEEIVLDYSEENKEKFDAENAAIISMDPRNGEILVMVGSRDYFDEEIDGNFNITTSKRQPGSVFKPIVYANAFSKGYRPETVVFDLETEFSTTCEVNPDFCYNPQNYDGLFRGPISLRDALAQSINIPAVKTLYLGGLRDSLSLAKKMGLETLSNADQYGLTLVLGGGEVRPIDVATAYSVFATEGIKNNQNPIIKIEDSFGEEIFNIENEQFISERVMNESVARDINSVLSDNDARSPMFGSNSYLYFGNQDVAAKTGTTNDFRDAWVVGYTPNLTTVAWVGNNDNRSMKKDPASSIVAPMWNKFLQFALLKRDVESFNKPEEKNNNVKPIINGFWRGQETDGIHSILHYVEKNNPLGDYPINPFNDSQYELWEKPVRDWVRNQDIDNNLDFNNGKIEIKTIDESNRYSDDETILIIPELNNKNKITSGIIILNEEKIGNLSNSDNSFSFIPKEINNIKSRNDLVIELYDEFGNYYREEFRLRIR